MNSDREFQKLKDAISDLWQKKAYVVADGVPLDQYQLQIGFLRGLKAAIDVVEEHRKGNLDD